MIWCNKCGSAECAEYKMANWTDVCKTVVPKKDNINPDHYKVGGIETIDFMKAKLSTEGFKGYLAGNVIKYITRYEHKNGLEDLKKSQWYIDRLIKELEAQ